MLDSSTKKDIEKISHNILKESKSFDIFPTPVDQILYYSNFAIDNSIDLQNIHSSFFEEKKEKATKSLISAMSKIWGMFDRSEKTIYIDPKLDTNIGKKNFVKLHEVGHGVLTWQNDIMLALDDDITLNAQIEEQFEAEANYFASITLFQHDRFLDEIEKSNLGIATVMQMSKKFGSSVHSALRNYVLNSKNRCGLLVLNPIKNENGKINFLQTRDLFYSAPFLSEFGELILPEEFGFKWAFVQDYKFKKKFNDSGIINLSSKEVLFFECCYHYFYNGFNCFVFFFPAGEKNNAKKKFILTS